MSYSQKQTMKEVKFRLRSFRGLVLTLLKSCYLTTVTWCRQLEPTRRKCFTVCECVSSHPTKLRLINESRHKKGNLIRKGASNTMIYMPERGSANTKSQFLTPRVIMQRHPIHPKFNYSRIYKIEEVWNTPGTAQECSPQIFHQTKKLCDITYRYPYMEPDVKTSSEEPNNSPTNPRSSKYILRQNPKLNCNDNCR